MMDGVQLETAGDGPLFRTAVALFTRRWRERTRVPLRRSTGMWRLRVAMDGAGAPHSYTIVSTDGAVTVHGADAHGVLYGLGHLLRLLAFAEDEVPMPAVALTEAPAVYGRGVYCATHFSNYYESAPLARLERYIEELALWGVDLLTFWLDCNWFPHGFWNDPDSRGSRMVARLRRLKEVARACGMTVGIVGLGNEGFAHQPTPALRVDMAARHGGFYPDSQICPSAPGGLDMILANRRIVLDLLGPIDLYVHWPYDQGGCGCDRCAHAPGRWGRTFLELGPAIAGIVRERNPEAQMIVSTWLMDDDERAMVYGLCDRGETWLDGIMTQVEHASEHPLPEGYRRLVFPEISMFDCYFCSYGCNGANPAPARFAAEARMVAAAGSGTTLYSEGQYEDANKVVYLGTLWNPSRDTDTLLEDYARYYFGATNAAEGADLLRTLETTWGARKLRVADPALVEELATRLTALGERLPAHRDARERWQALYFRAEMDRLMKQIGPEDALISESRVLFEQAAYLPAGELRARLERFLDALRARRDGIDRLFAAHMRYLRAFHMAKTNLSFLPDEMNGKYHWETLVAPLEAAARRPDRTLAAAVNQAIRRWYWFNGIGVDYLFF
jgi:hypothetical protein